MWHLPHVGIYQQKFFLQQLHYERRWAISIAICDNKYRILLTKKQDQDPENRQYIDKSQNDCYPYHNESTYIKAKNGISTFC